MDDITKMLLSRLDSINSETEFIRSVIMGEVDFQTSEKMYDKKQAASFLGVTYRTINRWLEEGLLTGQLFGHRIRFKESELVEFRTQNSDGRGGVKVDRSNFTPLTISDLQQQFQRKIGKR